MLLQKAKKYFQGRSNSITDAKKKGHNGKTETNILKTDDRFSFYSKLPALTSQNSQIVFLRLMRDQYLKDRYPKDLNSVTREWLSMLIGEDIEGYEAKVLEDGALSDAAIIKPKYRNENNAVASFVLKYAKGAEQARSAAVSTSAYTKELKFYNAHREDVARFIGIPGLVDTFVDPDEPDVYFCIAMEDLSVKYDSLDGVKGTSKEEVKILLKQFSALHAYYWNSNTIGEVNAPYMNEKTEKGHSIPLWYDSWLNIFSTDPENMFKNFNDLIKFHPLTKLDMEKAVPGISKVINVFANDPAKVINTCYKKLNAGPKTFVHGDLRSNNIFRLKSDPTKLCVIDWQSFKNCSPAVEFVQLISSSLSIEAFDELDELHEFYLDNLYSANIATRDYKKDTLEEDFAIASLLFLLGIIPVLDSILRPDPQNPLWPLMKPCILRMVRCLQVTRGCDVFLMLNSA